MVETEAKLDASDDLATVPPYRLMQRAGYGWIPSDLTNALRVSWDEYLAGQLAYESIIDTGVEARLALLPTLSMTSAQLYPIFNHIRVGELISSRVLRAVYSRRQLFERMVEFWHDHFNVYVFKSECPALTTSYDRDAIRPHALGKFKDLLKATAMSPAMITYLDNRTNNKFGPNQNYARELLELHTLGLASAFTENDVKEVARCFTGWSVIEHENDPNRGQFIFRPENHDQGAKTVLGHPIPANGGMQDGITVLEILADHPLTASSIANKLATFFYGTLPPKAYVRSIDVIFRFSGGDIRSTLQVALASSHLTKAPPLLRRPFHQFATCTRAILANVAQTGEYRNLLLEAGNQPFHWSPPNGYPLAQDYWKGNMLPRWGFAMELCANRIDGVSVPSSNLVKGLPTLSLVLDSISKSLFANAMPESLRASLSFFAGQQTVLSDRALRDLYGLAMSAPEFQHG
ncbi:MAG TPA: DUF1800 domain-containing protein [Fimbriimonadaceae bacterium]|nr:DUF1800 domain-containing protein [Fimbriimonadaceae bacterium]